jgi:protein-tyrosine phosphatase/arsenate reductase
MYQKIKEHCDKLTARFKEIPQERKEILGRISDYIRSKHSSNETVNLIYVCTHNSRRSHFGQVWSAVAASYYQIPNVQTFSGGTEATAFNPNAIKALRTTGFEILVLKDGENPLYEVQFGETESTQCFSKKFDDNANPKTNFAAIMTCSDADENCPFIPGVDLRIGTTYDDPKAFDGTPLQDEKYMERSDQIALECLYVFSSISNSK